MTDTSRKICVRCVMDTSASEIQFDSAGVCSFCTAYLSKTRTPILADSRARLSALEKLVEHLKRHGKGKDYDCVVGVSGGVDSSWVLVNAVRLGLRPLAVHMDNGWNSELAQNNIANLVRGLGVDLYTHVIEWTEYRGLMQAFFDADVIDVELLYDNAMLAVNFQAASRLGVRYILSGMNHATEGIAMPRDWSWCKLDRRNLRALGATRGIRLKTFPSIGTLSYVWRNVVQRQKWVWLLDYLDFNKFETLAELQSSFGYKPYPYKHYESVFTRFYQGYILPEKFGVDKRHVHLSSLVMSGQITRRQALDSLQGIAYPSLAELELDKAYFLKKMEWTSAQLEEYIRRPMRHHSEFASESRLYEACIRLRRLVTGKSGSQA